MKAKVATHFTYLPVAGFTTRLCGPTIQGAAGSMAAGATSSGSGEGLALSHFSGLSPAASAH
eukprot:4150455-Amphidinium_carterae.3